MLRPFALFLLALALSCSSSSPGASGTQSLWVAPASLDDLSDERFYDHPWPSDLRRDADGSIHLAGFYNPRQVVLVSDYVRAARGLIDGFSPVASAYLRFAGDIDPSTLPASPQAALDPGASVQIVDVDPRSPEHGRRRLLETFWQKDDGVYWLKDTLAVRPALGYPLLPKTRYALVVTSDVRAADGSRIAPSADLRQVLGQRSVDARVQAAHDLYAPAVSELSAAGLDASRIVHLAVFTTGDPTAELFAIADDVHAHVPAPTVDASSWSAKEQAPDYDVYEGNYGPSPNYQQGSIPFAQLGDGGGFVFQNGVAQVQSTFSLRFSLVVPKAQKCPMPQSGYPIALYAHGTGGDYRSIVDEGHSFGQALAQQCIASMGIDQIFHGTRPGSPPAGDPNREGDIELLFFNLNNPIAGRTNGRQAAIDVVQQARLFTDSSTSVPSSVSRTQSALAFDRAKLLFVGHSQGGVNGPLFLAADKQARGGVLSGTGAMLIVALLEKTSPQPSVAQAVKTILQLTHPDDAAELNLFHPVVNLAQTIVDPTDTVHYMPFIATHPRSGFAPKSILQTEGVAADGSGDTFAPPHGIEIASVALGLPREAPGVHAIAEASWSGLGDVDVTGDGLQGNLAGGRASGVLGQFVPPHGVDGHFVAFDVPQARAQVAGFCRNLADDPKGRVPALQ